MPGGVEIVLFTLSFDEGYVVPEFDGNFDFVVGRVGLGESRGCLIHFSFAGEAVPSFMGNFVTVRAGKLTSLHVPRPRPRPLPLGLEPLFGPGFHVVLSVRFPLVLALPFPLFFPFPFPEVLYLGCVKD